MNWFEKLKLSFYVSILILIAAISLAALSMDVTGNILLNQKTPLQKLESMMHDDIIDAGAGQDVADAMLSVPRHAFIPGDLSTIYGRSEVPVSSDGEVKEPIPADTAKLLYYSEVHEGDKVLVAGVSSGYLLAVLDKMGADVYAVEYRDEIVENVKVKLNSSGYQAQIFQGDEYYGLLSSGPFDAVIATGALPKRPDGLFAQTSKEGGVLVYPWGNAERQIVAKEVRTGFSSDRSTGAAVTLDPLESVYIQY